MAHGPPDGLVEQRVDVTDQTDGPQQRRDQDDRAGRDGEDCDNGCRHGAERDQRYRALVGAFLARHDQRAEEHEAADQRADREQDDAEVEPGIGLQRHVGGEHDAGPALQYDNICQQGANEHQREACPRPFGRSDATAQQHGGSEIQHGHLEEDDPDEQHVEAVRGQRQVEEIGWQKVHFRPARQRDEQSEESTDREKDDGNDSVGFDQLFGGKVNLEAGRRAGAKFCVV